jgi:integrase
VCSDEARSDVSFEASRDVSHEKVISIREGEASLDKPLASAAPQEAGFGFERARITAETSFQQKRGRSMLRRRGQSGSVVLRNDKYYGRFWEDEPDKRVRRWVFLGTTEELSKTAARRKLVLMLSTSGIHESEYLERVLGTATTFNQVADRWKKLRLPKLSYWSQDNMPRLIEKHLAPFFGAMPVDSIKTGTINEWIATLPEMAPKSVHNLYKLLRGIVNWHCKQEDLQPKKWGPDLPSIPDIEQRWFTPIEAQKVIEAASGQYKVLFHLAWATGMRFGELSGLHCDDIDLSRQVIAVRRSIYKGKEVPPKTKAGFREIFIDDSTVAVLAAHIEGQTGLVFKTRNGTPLANREVVFDHLHPVCEQLKLPRAGMHAFRHGRVSAMRVNGAPEDIVKRQIGHSSLRITSSYTHFTEDYQRGFANKIAGWTQVAVNGRREAEANQQRLN